MMSVSITGVPSSANIPATTDLPLAMPPVRPILSGYLALSLGTQSIVSR